MIGGKLTQRLVNDDALAGEPIERLTLLDVAAPLKPNGFAGSVETAVCDLATPGEAARVIARRPDVIFHLAGVVSAEAELDFDKGYRVNLDGSRALLEAIRALGDGYRPKLVYASSIAVFGNLKIWPPAPTGVANKHPQAYGNESTFRFNRRRKR